jgi:hypothetical protein
MQNGYKKHCSFTWINYICVYTKCNVEYLDPDNADDLTDHIAEVATQLCDIPEDVAEKLEGKTNNHRGSRTDPKYFCSSYLPSNGYLEHWYLHYLLISLSSRNILSKY